VVHVVPQRPHPARSPRHVRLRYHSHPVRSTAGIGPRTDTFPAVRGGPLRLIGHHNLRPHMYADDTQIYGFCCLTAAAQLQQHVSACIDDVAAWMQSNRLQLNTAKTEFLRCASSRRRYQLPQIGLETAQTMCHQHPLYVTSESTSTRTSP